MGIEVLIPAVLIVSVAAISYIGYMVYERRIARSTAAGLCMIIIFLSGMVCWFMYSSYKEEAIRKQVIIGGGLQQDMLQQIPKQAQSAGVSPLAKKQSAIIVAEAIKNQPQAVSKQIDGKRVTIDKLYFVDTMDIKGVTMYVFSCNPTGKLGANGDVLFFCKPVSQEVEHSFAQLSRGAATLLTAEIADIREVSQHKGYPVYGAMLMVYGISGY